ncbi:BQ5605_C061g12736 [Microbotryum silenes-dioicae]|uniref:BQ5605_C061g12736 protein n=1 Tax=Microbotryum silenes-dioicae TaxID=796604 RepID=A0A2X0MUY2_9BASI|nr:BQ5605_C061g12736 [Microbotryum silenes-dioicae]
MQLLSRFFRKRSADNTDDRMKQLAKLSRARLQQAKVIPSSDDTAVRILIDFWYFFDRIYVSKKHGAAKAFARAFSDAVFIPNADDRLLIKASLAKLGMTWEEAGPFAGMEIEALETRSSVDAKSKQPLFNKAAHEAAKRCLERFGKAKAKYRMDCYFHAHVKLSSWHRSCTPTLALRRPDGKADDGVRLYSCQRDTNISKERSIGTFANGFQSLVFLRAIPTPPSQFEEAATILTHSPLYSQVGTFNRTGNHFQPAALHPIHRDIRHRACVQSPTAQMRFLIEPYQVERGTLRLEPVKWSPWNLLQNNTPAIQHMQSRLAIDRKLRPDCQRNVRVLGFAVFKVRLGAPQNLRIFEITEPWNKYANGLDIFYKKHINTWAPEMVVAGKCSSHNEHGMLAANPLLGHKLPVLGRLTEVEVDFSDPSTSSIRAFVATASSAGSSADLGTSSALTRAGTTKGARHCRLCGQTTCRRKGTKLSDDGSVNECDGACLDCGKPFGLTDEMDPNDPQSRRFCRGLTRAEMNGRAWQQKKCHNYVAVL